MAIILVCLYLYGRLRWFRIPSLCNEWLVKHIIFGGRPSICLESAKGQGWYSVNRRGVFGWKSFILTCPGKDQFSGMTAERWWGQRKGISVLKTYIEWSKHSDSGVCFSLTPMQMFVWPSSASGCSVAWCHEKGQCYLLRNVEHLQSSGHGRAWDNHLSDWLGLVLHIWVPLQSPPLYSFSIAESSSTGVSALMVWLLDDLSIELFQLYHFSGNKKGKKLKPQNWCTKWCHKKLPNSGALALPKISCDASLSLLPAKTAKLTDMSHATVRDVWVSAMNDTAQIPGRSSHCRHSSRFGWAGFWCFGTPKCGVQNTQNFRHMDRPASMVSILESMILQGFESENASLAVLVWLEKAVESFRHSHRARTHMGMFPFKSV